MSQRRLLFTVCALVVVVAVFAVPASASIPGDLVDSFSKAKPSWTAAILPPMRWLFGTFLIFELFYCGYQIAFESGWSIREWAAVLIKFILTRGFWGAILLNAAAWMPDIISSLTQLGVQAAGLPKVMSPSDIWQYGLTLAETLADNATAAAWITDPATSIVLLAAMLLILVSFAVMSLMLIATLAESYFVLSIGYFFVAFGGSRWTDSMARNYLTLVLSIGVKILTIYCVLGAAIPNITSWVDLIKGIDKAPSPMHLAIDIMGGTMILAACTVMIPKILASVMTGALNANHSDVLAPMAMLTSAVSVGTTMALRATGIGSAVTGAMSAAKSTVSAATAAARTASSGAGVGGVGGAAPPSSTGKSGSAPVPPPALPRSV